MSFDPKHQSETNKSFIFTTRKKLNNYDTDPKQSQRLKLQKCKYCYYINIKIALQAFTKFTCKNCKEEFLHHNSNVNKHCMKCAEELNICCHCGAEMDW